MGPDHRLPRVVGRYELHRELAAGGMATVFLGRLIGAHGFAKCVAIKRLHDHIARDQELVDLLLEEARITERIRHPNVVAVLDVVADGTDVLLIMEYVHGEPLSRLIRAAIQTGRHCPPHVAGAILRDALMGLHAAHETTDAAGQPLAVIHRDISPQNIMVGATGAGCLVDFGIAKAVGSLLHTRTGEIKGKVPYMAPEVLRFEPASKQTDIWGAAVVLWELLCHRRMFRGESEMSVWGQILTANIEPPGKILGERTMLDDVVMRGLVRNAELRYQTAQEMAQDLELAGKLATADEVAAWVGSVVGPELAQRASVLMEIERMPLLGAPPDSGTTAIESAPRSSFVPSAGAMVAVPARPSRASWAPWVLAGVLAVGIVVVLLTRRAPVRAATLAPPPPVSVGEPTPEPPPTGLPARIEPAVVAPSAHPSSSAPRSKSVPLVRRTGGAVAPPKAAIDVCDPPYTLDSAGHKIFKVECVQGR